jgi:mono/diheme cytochrome c family protein
MSEAENPIEPSANNGTEEPRTQVVIDDAKFTWSTITLMLPTIVLLVVFYGSMEFVRVNAGAFSRDVYVRNLRSAPPVLGLPPELEKRIRGQKIYSAKCAACHQENGVGVPGQFPPLKGSEWVLAAGPDRIARVILDGVAGPITVKGAVYNNAMVPWRKQMNDEEVSDVLTFIRSNPEWGHSAAMVEEDVISAIREETAKHDGSTYTEAELLEVELKVPGAAGPETVAAPKAD